LRGSPRELRSPETELFARTAAVTYGYGSRGEIAESKPDAVFESLPELAAFLERHD